MAISCWTGGYIDNDWIGEDEGFDKNIVSISSSRDRATVHWTVAFKLFESPSLFSANKKDHPMGVIFPGAVETWSDEGFD